MPIGMAECECPNKFFGIFVLKLKWHSFAARCSGKKGETGSDMPLTLLHKNQIVITSTFH